METQTVKVSEKGQIAIPIGMRRSIGIKKGEALILVQEGQRILVEKAETIAKTVSADFIKLKKELSRWDELSDEALRNFEAKA